MFKLILLHLIKAIFENTHLKCERGGVNLAYLTIARKHIAETRHCAALRRIDMC